MAKEIVAYETSDGTFFKSKDEADQYEILQLFKKWYKDNKVYGRYGEYIDEEYMVSWLAENKDVIMTFLKSQN